MEYGRSKIHTNVEFTFSNNTKSYLAGKSI